jgi:integrase
VSLTYAEADALAAALDLDVDDIAVCHACLSFVTFALDSGDDCEVASSITPKVVSEVLGHSTIAMTLDRYSRAIPTIQETEVEVVAALVGS